MKQSLKYIFSLLFALTQCVAPLVHAHVGGTQANTPIHTHYFSQYIAEHHALQCSAEPYESQAVNIPHEYPRDGSLAILCDATPSARLIPSRALIINTPTSIPQALAVVQSKPQSHAPPYLS